MFYLMQYIFFSYFVVTASLASRLKFRHDLVEEIRSLTIKPELLLHSLSIIDNFTNLENFFVENIDHYFRIVVLALFDCDPII